MIRIKQTAGDSGLGTDSARTSPGPTDPRTEARTWLEFSKGVEKLRDVLEPEPVRESLHVRAGVSVAVIIALSGLGFGVFNYFKILRPFVPHIAIVLGLYGCVLYCFKPKEARAKLREEDVLRFYRHPRYWSFIIIASDGLMFTLCSLLLVKEQQLFAGVEKPLPPPVIQEQIVEPPQEPPPPPKPVDFPALTVTGVLLNGEHSSAVINGNTLHLGEYIEGVKLVEVASDGVVMQLVDAKKAYPLESAPLQSVNGNGARRK